MPFHSDAFYPFIEAPYALLINSLGKLTIFARNWSLIYLYAYCFLIICKSDSIAPMKLQNLSRTHVISDTIIPNQLFILIDGQNEFQWSKIFSFEQKEKKIARIRTHTATVSITAIAHWKLRDVSIEIANTIVCCCQSLI